jgi:hypothetical protein
MCEIAWTILMTILICSLYYNLKFLYIKRKADWYKQACKEFAKLSIEDVEKIDYLEKILWKIKKRLWV